MVNIDRANAAIFGSLLLILIVGNVFLTIAHEEAHKVIFSVYGIDSEIYYAIEGSYTQATESNVFICDSDVQTMQGMQALNEVMGYSTQTLFNILALSQFTIVVIFLNRGNT